MRKAWAARLPSKPLPQGWLIAACDGLLPWSVNAWKSAQPGHAQALRASSMKART